MISNEAVISFTLSSYEFSLLSTAIEAYKNALQVSITSSDESQTNWIVTQCHILDFLKIKLENQKDYGRKL